MIKFGTDGLRGVAGEDPITAEVAVRLGRAAAELGRRARGDTVVVARDTRPSGAMLMAACSAGVAAAGARCRVADVLPTSGLMAALAEGLGDVGVMVTASHNPARDNGFKVLSARGRKLTDAETAQVEAWIASPVVAGDPGTIENVALQAKKTYLRALERAAPPAEALGSVSIAVDLANGAASSMGRWLTERYPGVTWVFRGTGEGAINEGAGSEHPEGLAELVRHSGASAGLAVDGDADRCLLVDETGHMVPGDSLLWLLATGLGVGGMAITEMSTTALEASLPGIHIVRTPVGDRHVLAAMHQQGLALGGEESGHVAFSDGLPGGDGVLTGLRALAVARLSDRRLSETLQGFQPFPRRVVKIPVTRRPPLEELEGLRMTRAEVEAELGAGGRVFIRYSGTEPLLRILVEGPDTQRVEGGAGRLAQAAREALR
jgi:phosphoglucosamine mutase